MIIHLDEWKYFYVSDYSFFPSEVF